MRIAFGDLPGIESIQTLAAIERAKERGVNVELIILNDEDLAAQAIVGGQADVGIGAPYTLIQKVGVPIRLFAQISTLRFFPVVNSEFYKDWKDLDGQEIAVQARGSGTEAVMLLMAKNHGITYGNVSYVPGSEVRRNALIQGTIKASIVDAANRRALEAEAPGQVHRAAGRRSRAPPTKALFATADYLEEQCRRCRHPRRGTDQDRRARSPRTRPSRSNSATNTSCCPTSARRPMPRSPPITRRPPRPAACALNGGGADAAADDFAFFTLAGQIEGDAALRSRSRISGTSRALDRAVAKLGKK